LKDRKIDAYATNKANLHAMADTLPGAQVLDGNWGREHLAIALPRGRGAGLAFAGRFVEDIKASGLVTRASERTGLRGAVVAA
jgi:polar amino acid transport system substrate-binding protein